jgi:serine/threonine protein kinase
MRPMTHPSARTTLFDRYRIDDILGEGGQAVVLQAFDLRLNVPRALKVMLPLAARRQNLRDRFEREAQLLARLEHRNVIRVFDVQVQGPVPWFVMELVQGGTLADRLAAGPLPPHLVANVVDQLCAGLAEAHALGVVHRDVKPGNVLVGPGGVCKLVDFGIARIEDLAHTKQGVTMGTQGFMAPEQAQDASTVDLRADLYGVGMSAFALLSGRDTWEWIAGERHGVPDPLVPVLVKATARNRADRHGSASELAAAFRAAVATLPPDPPGTTLARPFTPRKTDPAVLADRLAEVQSWFLPPARPAPAPAPAPTGPPPARPGVAYTMSRPRKPAAEPKDAGAERPDWVSEEPSPPRGFEVSIEAPARKAPPPPPAEQRLLPPWAAWVIVALVLGSSGGVLGMWYSVYQQHVTERSARAHFVSAVREHLPVLSVLAQLGSDATELEALAASFDGARSEAERIERAEAIVDRAEQDMERLTEPGSAQRRQLEAAVAAMRAARDAWRSLEPPVR